MLTMLSVQTIVDAAVGFYKMQSGVETELKSKATTPSATTVATTDLISDVTLKENTEGEAEAGGKENGDDEPVRETHSVSC